MKKKHKLVVTTQADFNIFDAFQYYEFKQPDLGKHFLSSLEKCFSSIENNPEIYRISFSKFRQAKLQKFPYVVIYKVEQNMVVVTKVFNTYQNPIKKIK